MLEGGCFGKALGWDVVGIPEPWLLAEIRTQGASEPPETPWLGRAAALEPHGLGILNSIGERSDRWVLLNFFGFSLRQISVKKFKKAS